MLTAHRPQPLVGPLFMVSVGSLITYVVTLIVGLSNHLSLFHSTLIASITGLSFCIVALLKIYAHNQHKKNTIIKLHCHKLATQVMQSTCLQLHEKVLLRHIKHYCRLHHYDLTRLDCPLRWQGPEYQALVLALLAAEDEHNMMATLGLTWPKYYR